MTASHGAKCIGIQYTHTHTHAQAHAHIVRRSASNHIHSFAGLLGFGLSIFLCTYIHTRKMLSGFTKPLWHMHAQFYFFFLSLKNNHDRQHNLHTRTHINAYLTETTFKLYITTISRFSNALHLSVSHIEVWVENKRKKREISAEHNEPSILKLH